MALLTRENLLKKQELQKKKVILNNKTGEFVYVREMAGQERDAWERSLFKEVGKGVNVSFEQSLEDFRAKLAVYTVCDEEGKLLFKPSDYKTLSQNMSFSTLDKIVSGAQEVNKISEEDKKELVKN